MDSLPPPDSHSSLLELNAADTQESSGFSSDCHSEDWSLLVLGDHSGTTIFWLGLFCELHESRDHIGYAHCYISKLNIAVDTRFSKYLLTGMMMDE